MNAREWDLGAMTKIDTSVAHAARVSDYLLGGDNNFAVDREAAERAATAQGGLDNARTTARANRAFLVRAVRHLAGPLGVRQFLDIGTGIPNRDNAHAVAQQVAPNARIVYIDDDPVVLAHAHKLLRSITEGATAYLSADLRDPETILEQAADTLDFTKPVAVMLLEVLHFVADDEDPQGIVTQLLDAVPSGSYLTVSHLTDDIRPEETRTMTQRFNERVREQLAPRGREGIVRFFDGVELLEPGLVQIDEWRPPEENPPPPPEWLAPLYSAIGRTP